MDAQDPQHPWLQHLNAWRASKLTQKAYAQLHGLNPHSLAYWIKRERQLHAKVSTQVVPIRLLDTSPSPSMQLRGQGAWSLDLPQDTSAVWLAQLLQALS